MVQRPFLSGNPSHGLLHRTFAAGLLLKGLNAVLELGSAALFWTIKPGSLGPWLHALTASELAEDPHDLLSNWVMQAGGHYSLDVQHSAVLYLLCHGLIKLGLVLLLWRGKPWVYPFAAAVLGLFVTYLAIRWTQTHALVLVILGALDLVMIGLILAEYRRIRPHPGGSMKKAVRG